MIRENLVLLEYMVKKRIEEDSKRLDAIKKVNELLEAANIYLDNVTIENQSSVLINLTATKGKPLNYLENELIEEIFKINL